MLFLPLVCVVYDRSLLVNKIQCWHFRIFHGVWFMTDLSWWIKYSIDISIFLAELEAQLLESERLLGEITACTRENAPNINAMGDAMVSMEKAVEDMELELKK